MILLKSWLTTEIENKMNILLIDSLYIYEKTDKPIDREIKEETELQIRMITIDIQTKNNLYKNNVAESILIILKLVKKFKVTEMILSNFSRELIDYWFKSSKYLSKIHFLRVENMVDYKEDKDIKAKFKLESLVSL